MTKLYYVTFLIIILSSPSLAQDSRSIGGTSTSLKTIKLTPEQNERVLEAFNNHPYTKYYDRLIVEYEQRMKDNARKYKIMERKMEKPQYSDFSYFGHKRKPKKRPAGKMKYCKECEMVH